MAAKTVALRFILLELHKNVATDWLTLTCLPLPRDIAVAPSASTTLKLYTERAATPVQPPIESIGSLPEF